MLKIHILLMQLNKKSTQLLKFQLPKKNRKVLKILNKEPCTSIRQSPSQGVNPLFDNQTNSLNNNSEVGNTLNPQNNPEDGGGITSFFSGALNLFSTYSAPEVQSNTKKESKTQEGGAKNDLYYDDKLGRWVVRGVVYDEDDKPKSLDEAHTAVPKKKEFKPPPKSNSNLGTNSNTAPPKLTKPASSK